VEGINLVIQQIPHPAIVTGASAPGMAKFGNAKVISAKIGTTAKAGSILTGTKAAVASLSKSVTGTFWAGASWKLGLGLGLGIWGPVMLTAVSAAAIYNVTPAIIKATK